MSEYVNRVLIELEREGCNEVFVVNALPALYFMLERQAEADAMAAKLPDYRNGE